MKKPTRVNHPPAIDVPAGNRPVVAPIYQTVKFEFDTVDDTLRMLRGERPGFFYLRSSNPTTRALELTLAELQGRDDCLVCASGVGAIAQTLLALTRQGDHVLCFLENYGPTRYLIRRLLTRFGVSHTLLSIADLDGIERTLATQPTRLVIFESPTNPINRIADIGAITRLARVHGALSVLDNTFAGMHQHGQFDVDIFLHSLTKFASGHGDVMGGAVIGKAALIGSLRADFSALGGVLDPHAAFLLQRGLKTYFVRYRTQCASAQRVAELLAAHPAVERVHYPGLAGHPQHVLARAQMSEFGAVVSFDLRAGAAAARRFAEALQLFAMAASLGATDSLVMPSHMTFLTNHRDVLAAMDFFTVPTVTFRLLYVLFVIQHHRRKIVHVNVTQHPTATWVCQQLREAFPFDQRPGYLLMDHDSIFSAQVDRVISHMDVCPVRTSFQSPWQNGVAERWVGTCRRELLDHVIVLNEEHLRRLLRAFVDYYHNDRTHLSLGKDPPFERAVCLPSATTARVTSLPRVGGLHHRYEWRAAA